MTSNIHLSIAYLYPRSMNIYGDRGNIIALRNRLKWRNISTSIVEIEVGEQFDTSKYDILFAGGGQDKNQLRIASDLKQKKEYFLQDIEDGLVSLLICGSYQLFGHYFLTSDKTKLVGLGILDIITMASSLVHATQKRMIGNVTVDISDYKLSCSTLVGFENHSGITYLSPVLSSLPHYVKKENSECTTLSLGSVVSGFGNNGIDKTEGARYINCFGTYLHGSLLPKNPHFADYLISLALERKYKEPIPLKPLSDIEEMNAHNFILSKR